MTQAILSPARIPSVAELAATPEIRYAMRPFPASQELLSGPPLHASSRYIRTGWHDTLIFPLEGAFALIDPESGLDDLLGQVLAVHHRSRTVYVYCYTYASLPVPFSLYRRAFLGLDLLTTEEILARIEVIS